MPLSGSTNFSMTAGEIITRALKNCGIGLNGETPTAQETNDALEDLNILMKAYMHKGLKLFLMQSKTITLSADKEAYSLGPTGDVVMDQPIEIQRAFVRDSDNTNIDLFSISRDEYFNLTDKFASGVPLQYYYGSELSDPYLQVWPVPGASEAAEYTLIIDYRKPADDADATTDNVEFPPAWYRALIWGLTEEVMESYDLPDNKQRRIMRKAFSTLKAAEATDIGRNTSVYFQPNSRG